MTTLAKKALNKSNLVTDLPELPIELLKGTVSFNYSFEQNINCTINAESIPVDEIEDYRTKYRLNNKIALYNLPYRVVNYSEVVNRIKPDNSLGIEVYDISVSLVGYWGHLAAIPIKINKNRSYTSFRVRKVSINTLALECGVPYIGPYFEFKLPANIDRDYTTSLLTELQKYSRLNRCYLNYCNPLGIELKVIEDGTTYEFDESDLLYSIQTKVSEPPSYLDATLGDFDSDPTLLERSLIELDTKYFVEQPLVTTITQGEDVTVPPINSFNLKDLSSAADASGPRKSNKVTKLVNGNPLEETVTTYAFIYTAANLAQNSQTYPIYGSAAGYWQVLEQYVTQYQYKSASPESISVNVIDRVGNSVPAYYLPTQARVGFLEGAMFLVGSLTSGFKTFRFLQETLEDTRYLDNKIYFAQLDGDTVAEDYFTARKNALSWKQLGYVAETNYELAYYSSYYSIVENLPFSVDKVRPIDISNSTNISSYVTDVDGFVYIVRPDPNYTPGLFVLKESSYTNSYAEITNPENVLAEAEYNDASPADKPYITFYPPLVTGEEAYSITDRKIFVGNKPAIPGVSLSSLRDTSYYEEYTSSFSSSDSAYLATTTKSDFKTVLGKPPAATSYRSNYIAIDDLTAFRPTIRAYITSDYINLDSPANSSFNYDTFYPAEAKIAAETDLTINHTLSTYREEVNLAWFYESIKPFDYIDIETNEINTDTKRVISNSFTLDYITKLGSTKIVTCSGTKLSIGNYVPRSVVMRTELVPNRGLDLAVTAIVPANIAGNSFNPPPGRRG